ncbi:MAG TPA: GIY-YIG nuclease family protein, partial [Bacteroidales bacterium]
MELSTEIQKTLENLPHLPGVYQYFNADHKIIYVGKAKDLKKRVSSYFAKEHHDNAKLRILVRNIHEIRFIVVASESDALLLENNLIKEYQPRYNILLKDDKSFPWIAIKRETFPRVVYTRQLIKDGSEYFGPFTSTVMVKTLLSLIKQLFPLRTCKLDLSLDKITRKMYKPCLEFHMGNCLGPCIAKQSLDDYMENIQTIRDILKGNLNQVSQHLK